MIMGMVGTDQVQSTNPQTQGLDSMTESVRARRCERHTTPDVGHQMDDDRDEFGLRSCILGRSFGTRLVLGENTGSRRQDAIWRDVTHLFDTMGSSMEHS